MSQARLTLILSMELELAQVAISMQLFANQTENM